MHAMREPLEDWHSFRDPTLAGLVARTMREEFGAGAKGAALDRVLAARTKRRRAAYRFWLCVLCLLHGVGPTIH